MATGKNGPTLIVILRKDYIKLCAFKASRGHPSKVVKLPIMSPGAENMEYLNNPQLHNELHLCCVINVIFFFHATKESEA